MQMQIRRSNRDESVHIRPVSNSPVWWRYRPYFGSVSLTPTSMTDISSVPSWAFLIYFDTQQAILAEIHRVSAI
jgi:hypothetical protein